MLPALVLAKAALAPPLPEPADTSPPVVLEPPELPGSTELAELASGADVIGGAVVNGEVSAVDG